MKLQPSSAPRGVSYYIDNFQIRREPSAGLHMGGDAISIDNFNQQKDSNALG